MVNLMFPCRKVTFSFFVITVFRFIRINAGKVSYPADKHLSGITNKSATVYEDFMIGKLHNVLVKVLIEDEITFRMKYVKITCCSIP